MMQWSATSVDCQRGFTLLEILVAFTILGIAITVIIQLFSANMRSIATSEGYTAAISTAEAKMRRILDNPSRSEGQWSEQTDDGYLISITVSDILSDRTVNLPLKMQKIGLILFWMDGSKQKSIRLETAKLVEKLAMESEISGQLQ